MEDRRVSWWRRGWQAREIRTACPAKGACSWVRRRNWLEEALNKNRSGVSDWSDLTQTSSLRFLRVPAETAHKFLDDVERDRYYENAEERCAQHAANNCRSHGLPRYTAGAGGKPKWYATENKGERSHQNRPQANTRAGERGVGDGFATLIFDLR